MIGMARKNMFENDISSLELSQAHVSSCVEFWKSDKIYDPLEISSFIGKVFYLFLKNKRTLTIPLPYSRLLNCTITTPKPLEVINPYLTPRKAGYSRRLLIVGSAFLGKLTLTRMVPTRSVYDQTEVISLV